MSNKLKFIWIDDDPGRNVSAVHLQTLLGVRCHFVNVSDENSDYLKVIDTVKPDLILVDHNLTEIASGIIKKGSTIAAIIREKHPAYAIACITGQGDNQIIDTQQRLSYEAIFDYDDIKAQYSTMKSIAESFRKLTTVNPTNFEELFSLIKAPNDDIIKLKSILPPEIKENFKDPSLFSNISYWIRNVLLKRPGFLYDSLWAATILGLSEAGFNKVKHLFEKAKYKGLFKDDSKELWWKTTLLEILSKKVKTDDLPWEKGRDLPGINSRNYSKDYYSDFQEPFPETVAYVDETSNDQVQIKLKYTVPHPKFDKLLFFEDIKMMKAD